MRACKGGLFSLLPQGEGPVGSATVPTAPDIGSHCGLPDFPGLRRSRLEAAPTRRNQLSRVEPPRPPCEPARRGGQAVPTGNRNMQNKTGSNSAISCSRSFYLLRRRRIIFHSSFDNRHSLAALLPGSQPDFQVRQVGRNAPCPAVLVFAVTAAGGSKKQVTVVVDQMRGLAAADE